MITYPKIVGIVAAAFVAGSFVASPELRAFAANTVGSADIIDGSIQSIDIGTGQVKAADIGTDAVSADELKGVTKLLFGQCVLSDAVKMAPVTAGGFLQPTCNISGVDTDDSAIATLNGSPSNCFIVAHTQQGNGIVIVQIRNNCSITTSIGASTAPIGIIVFDK